MTEVTANLLINFASFAAETPFELVVDDIEQIGNKPVEVEYSNETTVFMQAWGLASWEGSATGFDPLTKMEVPGTKRIKVYCSLADAPSVRILVDNGERIFNYIERHLTTVAYNDPGEMHYVPFFGSAMPQRWRFETIEIPRSIIVNKAILIGRRYDPIVEDLTWSGDVIKRLRYYYDRPDIEILQKTLFRDKTGATIQYPVYDQDKGEFHTNGEAIGAIVVRYRPGYSLYNIVYDTGEAVASPELFAEMKNAWVYGDIKKAEVPPVRLVALSDKAATTASFPREFWPNGFPRVQHVANAGIPDREWNDNWQEVVGTRQTMMNRLYLDPNDLEAYVDVETITYIEGRDDQGRTFKLRMLNGASDP